MRSRWALAVVTGVAAATVVAGSAYAEPVKPFGPYGPAPAGSHVRVSDGDLTITSPRADGGMSVTIYRAASGVSGATLLRDFAAANLVSASMAAEATSEAVVLVDPTPGYPVTTCMVSSGAAYLGNPSCTIKYRWRTQSGRGNPLVYFRDHTPSQWPVHSSATKWNTANPAPNYIDVGWTAGSCPWPSWCVDVWNAYYTGSWLGLTHFEIDSSGYFINGGVVVHLNDRTTGTSTKRAIAACHEMGHALGVGHSINKGSCMWSIEYGTLPAPTSNTNPSVQDFTLLRLVYP